MSADGRYVAFESSATDLVPGDGTEFPVDVFVHDRQTSTTTRVSVDMAGGDPDSHSERPMINADGRYVAFSSLASDLVPGDDNGRRDVFVRDLHTATTRRIRADITGIGLSVIGPDPVISADGRYVAFHSDAGDLVPGDGNSVLDVFVQALLP
jgi:Tol biopolymer transport system component